MAISVALELLFAKVGLDVLRMHGAAERYLQQCVSGVRLLSYYTLWVGGVKYCCGCVDNLCDLKCNL